MKNPRPTALRFVSASALALLVCLASPLARAATLTWDPTGAPTAPVGSGGTWNTTSAQWSDGTTDLIWGTSTTNPDIAFFSNPVTAYAVTLNSAVYAGGLSVVSATNTVTLSGTGSVTLTGATPQISVAGGQLNLNTTLAGTVGFEKIGSGILRIGVGGGGTYTGVVKITAGQITNDINNGLSTNASLSLANATYLSLVGKNQSVAGLTGTSGTTVRSTATTSTFTVTAGSGTFAGTLSDGTLAVRLNFVNSGGSLTLSGVNAYRGTTEISGGTLTLASSLFSAGTGTSSVTVSGGNLVSSVASVLLGVGDFAMTSGGLNANGNSIGTFTLAADKNFSASAGTINFTLGLSNTSDSILGSGTGSFSLTGGTILALSGAGTSVAGSYTLFSGFGGTNTVSGLTITGLSGGLQGVLGTNGILVISASAIPEPSTYAAIIGVMLLSVACFRRRLFRK